MSKSINPTVKVSCRGCDATVRVPTDQPGARFKCPKCGGIVVVPSPAATKSEKHSEMLSVAPERFDQNSSDESPAGSKATFSLACPQCGSFRTVTQNQVGQSVTCGDCLEEFVVSQPAASPEEWNVFPDSAGDLNMNSSDGPNLNLDEIFPGSASSDEFSQTASINDDGFPNVPAVQPKTAGNDDALPFSTSDAGVEVFEFTLVCPLCGTRLEATTDQIGDRMKCPDCFSEFAIRQPPPSKLRRRSSTPVKGDDELRIQGVTLGFTDESLPTETLPGTSSHLEANETSFPQHVHRDLADEWMSKARAETEQIERETPLLPIHPFTHRLFAFLAESHALTALVGLALLLALEVNLASQALALFGTDSPVTAFICMMMFVGCALVGIGLFIFGSANFLAILRDTSEGKDLIESWPGMNFSDIIFDAFYVGASLFYSSMPGYFLGQSAMFVGASIWVLLSLVGLSTYVLFPFILLSGLENQSPFFPVSRSIRRTLNQVPRAWLTFYMLSAGACVLVAIGVFCLAVTGFFVGYLAAVGTVFFAMTYFRLLGRLTWICVETTARETE